MIALTCALGRAEEARAPRIFIQELVDELVERNVELISIGVHAKPPGSSESRIVAHNALKSIGKISESEDDDVMLTNRPKGPIQLEGSIYDVILPLYDTAGKTIGTAHIHVKPTWGKGDPRVQAVELARKYRNELSERISSEAALFKPSAS
ncbi:MAG: TonB-dependent siderophore receptor [Verrucomicrobia bacterium]|nr:TonB-dependent siderophore receptor [Verrucomicrobiota bacterium]